MYQEYAWKKYDGNTLAELNQFSENYKAFISECKTERLCVKKSLELCKKEGFKDLKDVKELKPGDKVYAVNKNKNIAAFVIGDEPLTEGLAILGAHIDSPRMDLKQNPLYESDTFVYLDTHYYGGIIKYQWVTIPLALYGVVVKKDGTTVSISLGDNENDPVVGITDLLPHLAAEKMQKAATKVIEGEGLDLLIGSIPMADEDKEPSKKAILNLLKEKYGIEEEDFVSAEIEVVPAGKARDFGLDRSMIAGYGHDDRVCAYTSLMALLDTPKCKKTTCAVLVDKEEVGSIGATGASSKWFENTIAELISKREPYNDLKLRKALTNSVMLSSDVSAALDPLYASVMERKNSAFIGKGICFNKYTGSRGKSGCNDAQPEFIAKLRKMMDDNEVNYQTSELGKVDQGGGGTIAYILANYNMSVIDAGVPVLSMHAPMEIVSKVDVYEAYLAYKVFLKNA
ncbi:MAG: aminopeptidase [Roseburia sp.]|nr:aminopeptidase [Anaeroplasma bactoclasticum]MCM1195873.1 aminopeptidase [Roseburia sp.]MCM1556539.1 aminopeptidase [Anaeroplasma bactoclasticum]